jgi:prepilin signal peptidase PulO-like enzyme (type II secretory pathway)
MELVSYIIYFAAGTFAGSFFYTLAERYSDGRMKENPVKSLFSRSICPECGKVISSAALIPVFGYIFSAGKCSSCGGKISLKYPLMEILFGLLAILVAAFHGTDILSLFVYLISATVITIAIVDIKTMMIPLSLNAVFFVLSIYPVVIKNDYPDSLYGFLFLAVFFLVIMFIFPGAFGGGDLKLYAIAGFLLGLEMSVVLLEVSLISGAVFGVIWGAVNGWKFRIKIPFAPFIAAGIIITLLFGNTIILFYYRNIYSF